MPLSPELKLIPGITAKFFNSGLAVEIVGDMIKGTNFRNLGDDALRLSDEYSKSVNVNLSGLENIPEGGLIAFNHPNNDILLPGMLKLIAEVRKVQSKDVSIVMASEVMLSAKLNDKTSFPGSQSLLSRLHKLYPNNIISAPTVTTRKDFEIGRAIAARKVMRKLNQGNLVAISPEGHVEVNEAISPPESFHAGSGALARIAAKIGKSTVPVAFWHQGSRQNIFVNIGTPFFAFESNDTTAVNNIMARVSELLPNRLRGPYETRTASN